MFIPSYKTVQKIFFYILFSGINSSVLGMAPKCEYPNCFVGESIIESFLFSTTNFDLEIHRVGRMNGKNKNGDIDLVLLRYVSPREGESEFIRGFLVNESKIGSVRKVFRRFPEPGFPKLNLDASLPDAKLATLKWQDDWQDIKLSLNRSFQRDSKRDFSAEYTQQNLRESIRETRSSSKTLVGKIQRNRFSNKWKHGPYCVGFGLIDDKPDDQYPIFISSSDQNGKELNKAVMNLAGEDIQLNLTRSDRLEKKLVTRRYKGKDFIVTAQMEDLPPCDACLRKPIRVTIDVNWKGSNSKINAEGFCSQ